MKKVGMISLGCAKNLVDSEVMLGQLADQGYVLTPEAQDADVVIVNTCGFIDKAKEESIETILEMAELKKQGRLRKLIVSGCLSQRYHQDMKADLPEVDLFLGVNQVGDIGDFIQTLPPGKRGKEPGWEPEFLYNAGHHRVLTTPNHSAYLKISEGCDHVCAFCIIPKLRGKHRSRPIDDIVREAEALAAQGVVEVNLVAQDSTYYGRDLGLKDGLAQLLEALVHVVGLRWIRVHYMYPFQVSARLLDVMGQHPKICKYLDMPLQHADKRVLDAMKRGGSRAQLQRFIDRIREAIPGVWIRSSFITGFPVEDTSAFEELCGFVRDCSFDYLGVFTYSQEDGTGAEPLGDPIAQEEKEARKEQLLDIQREISKRKLESQVGKTLDVLVEGVHPETELLLRGRHQGQAPEVDGEILITEGTYSRGDIIPVTIEETFDYDMAGRVIGGIEV